MVMGDRLLLRGGHVLTVDPELGDLPHGDVLIDGDRIAEVAPRVDADAEVVDTSGKIVIPGFIDTHRHTWEAAIRGCAPNATLDDYFVEVLDTYAPIYRPEDVYASNLAGALECINAGITTLVDWSHINNTPDHPDAGIRGLQEAGIRAQYAYGSANTSLVDYWYESTIAIPGDDVKRIRDTYFSSGDGLLTMALATRGTGFCKDEVVRAEWGLARELGIPITVHVAMGRVAGRFGMIKQLGDMCTQMRCAFGCERARVNAVFLFDNAATPENMLTARQMLEMATRNGAHVAGLEDRTGSLTPGKKADVVVIDATSLNVAPVIDPVAAVTLCADVSNVDTVIIDGKVRKRDGKLLADVDTARRQVQASSEYLVRQVEQKKLQQA